jgi:hypothetical protein
MALSRSSGFIGETGKRQATKMPSAVRPPPLPHPAPLIRHASARPPPISDPAAHPWL